MRTYYRGDRSIPQAPPLTRGAWLTPDAEIAASYGAAHRYDLEDPEVLDLTDLGVDGDGLDEALVEAGIDPASVKPFAELYQAMEQPGFLAAAAAAGYDLVSGWQWNADLCDGEPYEAAIVTGRRTP